MTKRNDPCPCGSNEKYKKCCGKTAGDISISEVSPPDDAARKAAQAQHHYQTATIQANQGNLLEAIASFRHALSILPAAEVYYNLAIIEARAGMHEDALESCLKARDMKPGLPFISRQLGIFYRLAGKYPEAISCLREEIANSPENAELHNLLGLALKESGNLEAAIQEYRHAIRLDQNYGEAYQNLAVLFYESQRPEEAIAVCKQALHINGKNSAALFFLAEIYERRGEVELAFDYLARAQASGHPHDACSMVRAQLLYQQDRIQEAIDELLGNKIDVTSPPHVAAKKYFMLGKFYDRMKRSDEAFACLQRGNRIQEEAKPAQNIDRGIYENIIENSLAMTRDNAWPDALQLLPGDRRNPVFLVGFPRSGTTLLDQLLDSHPAVQVMEEQPFLDSIINRIGGYPEALRVMGQGELASLRSEYFGMVDGYLSEEQQRDSVIADKFPLHIIHIGLIRSIFPGAKIILSLRHPLDVCLSNFMQFYSLNEAMVHFLSLESTAKLYALVFDLWFQYQKAFDIDLHIYRYEDLVEDTENEAKKIIGFLGLDWHAEILDYFQHARSEKFIQTPSYFDVRQPIFKRAKFRWQRYRKQLDPIIPILAPYVRELGYNLEN